MIHLYVREGKPKFTALRRAYKSQSARPLYHAASGAGGPSCAGSASKRARFATAAQDDNGGVLCLFSLAHCLEREKQSRPSSLSLSLFLHSTDGGGVKSASGRKCFCSSNARSLVTALASVSLGFMETVVIVGRRKGVLIRLGCSNMPPREAVLMGALTCDSSL